MNLNDPDGSSPVVDEKTEFEIEEKCQVEKKVESEESVENEELVENRKSVEIEEAVEKDEFNQKLTYHEIYQQVDHQDIEIPKVNDITEFEVKTENFSETQQKLDGGFDHPEIVNEQWEQLTSQDQQATPTSVEFNDYKQFLPHQNTIVEQDSIEIGIADQANQQTLVAINEGIKELENSVAAANEFQSSFEVGKDGEDSGEKSFEHAPFEEMKVYENQQDISQVDENQFEMNNSEYKQFENSNQFDKNPFRQEISLDESEVEKTAVGENTVREIIEECSVDDVETEANPMESNTIPLHEEMTVINSQQTVYEIPEAEEMELVIENPGIQTDPNTSDVKKNDLEQSAFRISDLESCKITDSVTVTPETEFPITQIEAMKGPTDLITSENEATIVGEPIVLTNDQFQEAKPTELFIKHEVRESTQIYECTEMLKEELSEIENLVNECFDPETKDSEIEPPIIACPRDLEVETVAAEYPPHVPYTELVDTDVENEFEFEKAKQEKEDHETISLTSRSSENERLTKAEDVCLENSAAAMVDDNSVNVDTSMVIDNSINLENSDFNTKLVEKTTEIDIFGNQVDIFENGEFDGDKYEKIQSETSKFENNNSKTNIFEDPNHMINSNNYSEITEGPDDLSEENNCVIAEVPASTNIPTELNEIPDSSKFDDTNADNATRNFFSEDDDADFNGDNSLMAEAPSNAFMPDSPAVHANFEQQRDLSVGVNHEIQQDIQQDTQQVTQLDFQQSNSSEFNYQQEISTLKSGSVPEEESLHSGNDTSYTNPHETTSTRMGVGVSSLGAPAIELFPATPNPPSSDVQNMIENIIVNKPEDDSLPNSEYNNGYKYEVHSAFEVDLIIF